ncbi:MAG: hypothetical protein OEX05_07795, partial [Chloroflexota bacterium]|nr:hypothetical protein [Chloroflexota bacterium]
DDLGQDAELRDRSLLDRAHRIRASGPADVGLAVAVHEAGRDTRVSVAIVSPKQERVRDHVTFLGGRTGRARAALAAAADLFAALRDAREPAGEDVTPTP